VRRILRSADDGFSAYESAGPITCWNLAGFNQVVGLFYIASVQAVRDELSTLASGLIT
jgi:hypothetical protein